MSDFRPSRTSRRFLLSRYPRVLALFIVFAGSTLTPVLAADDKARMRIVGHGATTGVPDLAHVGMAVSNIDREAADAMRDNGKKMRAVVDAMLGAGVERRDIETTSLHITPEYEHYGENSSRTRLIGYRVNNRVEVTIRDIPRLGSLIDTLVALGINNISELRFSIDNRQELEKTARSNAVADALQRAKQLADDLGIRLVRILEVFDSEIRGSHNRNRSITMGLTSRAVPMSASISPIEQGHSKISASVTVVWEIE